MVMDDSGDAAEVKSGKELFLELLRLLPSCAVEDYYQNGQWRDEDMQLDFDLLTAHRSEAGAEDPPSLEELDVPELPGNKPAWGGAAGYQRPLAGYGSVGPGAATPRMPVQTLKPAAATFGLRPQPPKSAPSPALVAAAATTIAGGPSAELRQIALFIAKWKLEATKTKLLLARLTPPRRRWVMSNFSQSGGGLSATTQLEQYISQCERNNAWASAGGLPAAGVRPVSGLKRPMTTPTNFDPYKRAKVGSPGIPMQRPGVQARPAIPAYGRAQPAWLGGGSAASGVYRQVPVATRPLMTQRATYGGGIGSGYGVAKPGMPRPGAFAQRPPFAARPAAPKYGGYGGGSIKPAVPKPKAGGGAKPGSLIANLLRM